MQEKTGVYGMFKICVWENGYEWDEWTTAYAASNGQIECLKYARENGCKWDKCTTAYAASNGHIECLKYARENGCEWDKWTTAYAAENGQIECLKYVLDNGCKYEKEIITEEMIKKEAYLEKYKWEKK